MTNMKLGYLGINSAQRDEWLKIGHVLGLGLAHETTEDVLYFRLDEYRNRIAIHKSEEEGFAYVGWDCGTPQALKARVAAIKDAGIDVVSESAELAAERGVCELASFKDINGFRTEFFYGAMVHNDPMHHLEPVEGRFVTADEGMGHVVFAVPDLARTRDFYIDVLGFRLTDMTRGPWLTIDFLRCNPRHHSLGLMQGRGAALFQHLMLQAETLDDVGRAYDRAEKHGIKIACTLGRHNVEKMVSFYIETPSGFDIEFGSGAIRVDDEENWSAKVYDPGSHWGHTWLRKWG